MVLHGTMFTGGGCSLCGFEAPIVEETENMTFFQADERTIVGKSNHHHRNPTVEELEEIAEFRATHPEYESDQQIVSNLKVEHAHIVLVLKEEVEDDQRPAT